MKRLLAGLLLSGFLVSLAPPVEAAQKSSTRPRKSKKAKKAKKAKPAKAKWGHPKR